MKKLNPFVQPVPAKRFDGENRAVKPYITLFELNPA
jgi:hypothetical protein